METVKINVSGPVPIGAKVHVIGGPWRRLTGTVACRISSAAAWSVR